MSARLHGSARGLLAAAASAAAAPAAPPAVVPLGDLHAGLAGPARVAAAAAGRIYVVEPTAGQVVVYDAFGRISATRDGFAAPLAVAVDADGRILVGEAGPGTVRVFASDWTPLYTLGAGAGEFTSPGFIAPAPAAGDGLVYVADGPARRVAAYSNGVFAFTVGGAGSGPGQFNFPAGLCLLSNELYVVDQAGDRIEVFDRGGAFLRQFSLVITNAAGTLGGRAHGLAADRAGRLYVADAFQGFVKVFGPTGALLEVVGSLGDGPGQLRSPVDLALDPWGRLCIAAPNLGRIERFGIDDYLHPTATPADPVLPAGSNLLLAVSCGGAGPYTFQWTLAGLPLPGATNASLALAGLPTNAAGDYAVIVTGPAGAVTAGTAVAVLAPPALAVPPAGQTVARGADAEFTVVATGDALAYQWYHGSQPLAGATGAAWTVYAARETDAGPYRVVVSNAVGAAWSEPALLTVLRPPAILLEPTDVKVIAGNAALFGVAAEGDELAFGWRFNGGPLPAPDDPTLAVVNAQPAAAGLYSVIVSNPLGVVTSAPAQLSVFLPPEEQQLGEVAPQPDGTVKVTLRGSPGYTFSLDASPDLVSWGRLASLPGQTGWVEYVDVETGPDTNRFYRLRWRP